MHAFDTIYILSIFGISLRIKSAIYVILLQKIHKNKEKKGFFWFHCIICKGIYPVEGGKHPVFVMVPVLPLFGQVKYQNRLN